MIVISGALVLVALVLLVIGLIGKALGFVYASIAVSLAAFAFLGIGIFQRRREELPATTGADPARTGDPEGVTTILPTAAPSLVKPAAVDAEPAADATPAETVSGTVLVVAGRPRYHVDGCRYLAGKDADELDVNDAREEGFTACGVCKPDVALAGVAPAATSLRAPAGQGASPAALAEAPADVADAGTDEPNVTVVDAPVEAPARTSKAPTRIAKAAARTAAPAAPKAAPTAAAPAVTAAEPATEPVTEPVTEPATKPATKTVTKPATKPATKTVTKPTTKAAALAAATPAPVKAARVAPVKAALKAPVTKAPATKAPAAKRPGVIVIPDRGKFHTPECRYVRGAEGTLELSKAAATKQGYAACGVCNP